MISKIITIGKTKNKDLNSQILELKKRLKRCEILELKEVKDSNEQIVKKKEFELIKPHIDKNNFTVLLIEDGSEFSTKGFYNYFKACQKPITFIITGAFGPCKELRDEVDFCLSLSKMTFTHEQCLYLLVEQIYRFDCFEKNIPYTK